MADCEVLAKQNADILYFLIVPVKPSATPLPGWRPVTIGNLGQSASLLASADALVGLRNGALELYRDPLTFAVKDPDTNTTYKWKPANGVSELKSRELNGNFADARDRARQQRRDRSGARPSRSPRAPATGPTR